MIMETLGRRLRRLQLPPRRARLLEVAGLPLALGHMPGLYLGMHAAPEGAVTRRLTRTLGLLHTLKILVFLAKSKNRYFCLFFCLNLTVLGVLVGSGGQQGSQRPYWDACCPQMAIN
jgi:hypothetical protein